MARAFLKDAPILILDEPTSSIDSKTEAVILEALERLMEGRTTFMVAHRLSTIHQADLTLVMNHGEVVEQGTHEELIARDGLYKQLHDAQHGTRRRAAAAVSTDGLSEMTKAITEARESGRAPPVRRWPSSRRRWPPARTGPGRPPGSSSAQHGGCSKTARPNAA